MSNVEFEQADRQLEEMVCGNPEGAEAILKDIQGKERGSERICVDGCTVNTEAENARKQARERAILKMVIKVVCCAFAAALFLAALLDSAWVPVICIAGIMSFVVWGAIILDRFFRGGSRYGKIY